MSAEGSGFMSGITAPQPPTAELLGGFSVGIETVSWQWDGWIAAGKLHLIAGAPGTGKTTMALGFATATSTGGRWPDGTRAPLGDVVIWSGEDGIADTLAPRLVACGADMKRIHFVIGVREGEGRRVFDPASDAEPLARALDGLPEVGMVILDPLSSAVAGDSNKNAEVRRALNPLIAMAERRGIALLGITHLTKGTAGRDPLERVTGSLAFGAAARVVLFAARVRNPRPGAANRIMVRVKSNIGQDGDGFGYELVQREAKPGLLASTVQWCEALHGDARELLEAADTPPADTGGDSEAVALVREILSRGAALATDVYSEAAARGISESALKRAGKRLDIVRRKVGMAGGWYWTLPEEATKSPPIVNTERTDSSDSTDSSNCSYRPKSSKKLLCSLSTFAEEAEEAEGSEESVVSVLGESGLFGGLFEKTPKKCPKCLGAGDSDCYCGGTGRVPTASESAVRS